jgi:hypothetical protein
MPYEDKNDQLWGWVQYFLTINCEYLFLGAGTVGTHKVLLQANYSGNLPNIAINTLIAMLVIMLT